MKYGLAKLHHGPRYEPSISPKGRKEGDFRPFSSRMRFCQLNTVVFLYEILIIELKQAEIESDGKINVHFKKLNQT